MNKKLEELSKYVRSDEHVIFTFEYDSSGNWINTFVNNERLNRQHIEGLYMRHHYVFENSILKGGNLDYYFPEGERPKVVQLVRLVKQKYLEAVLIVAVDKYNEIEFPLNAIRVGSVIFSDSPIGECITYVVVRHDDEGNTELLDISPYDNPEDRYTMKTVSSLSKVSDPNINYDVNNFMIEKLVNQPFNYNFNIKGNAPN